jgi:aspartate aminotransferase
MPSIAERAKLLPASPIRKLVPFAEQAKSRGIKVYHLNIGQPDIETPPQFFEAIRDANIKVLAYSHSAGIMPLRTAIVDYYKRLGHPLLVDNVLITTGASEALQFVFGAILNPRDEVIIPEPYYANYSSFSIAKDATVVPITTTIENDFALPEIDAFEQKITPRTKAILICNPSNPTGVIYPRESLEKLGSIARKHDLFLIADEVYREFVYDSLTHHSTLGLRGLEDRVIVVDSISKRFSACGARIGCVISRNSDLMDAALRMGQARLSPPTLGQIGAVAVYQLGDDFFRKIVAEFAARRDVLKQSLDAINGVVCPRINGAFYAMVRLPVDDAENFCRWMLEEFEHQRSTVMLAPGDGFYATSGLGTNEVRIAYVLERQELRKSMECLAAGLAAYNGKRMATSHKNVAV